MLPRINETLELLNIRSWIYTFIQAGEVLDWISPLPACSAAIIVAGTVRGPQYAGRHLLGLGENSQGGSWLTVLSNKCHSTVPVLRNVPYNSPARVSSVLNTFRPATGNTAAHTVTLHSFLPVWKRTAGARSCNFHLHSIDYSSS